MTRDMDCPTCKTEFEADEWDCGREYYFYEDCLADYSDCWICVEWI